ncbi:MAG: hypothetical protein KAI83_03470 [Thiomargarita sp.]|jgi:hypothetical protein|nr:hypothetical protein [Thiomargarita sp.]
MALIKLIAEHLIPSALIGFTAYWLTGQGHLITIALLTGWLIDSDHLLDFFMAKWRGKIIDTWQTSIKSGSYFKSSGKIIVFLHSYELATLWLLVWGALGEWEIGIVGSFAWLIHLAIDHFSYSLNAYAYFLSYRVYKKFDINAICSEK